MFGRTEIYFRASSADLWKDHGWNISLATYSSSCFLCVQICSTTYTRSLVATNDEVFWWKVLCQGPALLWSHPVILLIGKALHPHFFYLNSATCSVRVKFSRAAAPSRTSNAAFSRIRDSFSLDTVASTSPRRLDSWCACSNSVLDVSCRRWAYKGRRENQLLSQTKVLPY